MYNMIEDNQKTSHELAKALTELYDTAEANQRIKTNTCTAWIDNLNNLKKEYEEFFKNGVESQYIKDRIKNFKKYNQDITEQDIEERLKYQYKNLNEFDFSEIVNHPLFTINKTGRAARHQIKNCYAFLEDVLEYYNTPNIYIYERVVYDYIRPYFDLDFKIFTVEGVKETLNFIYDIIETDFKPLNDDLKIVGIAEYKYDYFKDKELEKEFNKILNSYEGMLTFKNNVKEFTKSLSIHIYVNGVCFNADDLKKYLNDRWLDKYKNNHDGRLPSGFDLSVYKTEKGKQQMFRLPYSGKADPNTPRPANPEILKYMENEKHKKFIIKNCVICAGEGDYIIKHETHETEKKEVVKAKKGTEGTEETENEDISIFKFLTIDGEIQDATPYFEDINHFEFGQKLFWLLQGLPLDENEFLEEILLINPTLNVDKFYSKYTYTRDFKCLFKLEVIKSGLNNKINELKEIKKPTPEDEELLKMLYYIKSKLKAYIEKYEKNDFIEHEFYDFKELKKGLKNRNIPKQQKIKYNCFKTVDDDSIYYVKDKKIENYKNKESMRKDLSLSGEKAKNVYDSLVCFKNVNEFELMRLEKKYDDEKDESKKSVDDLIELIKESHVYDDDLEYYISWLSNKMTYKTTNYRSIICQGNTEAGQDALKTYITQILSPFIEVKTADIRNLNKNLNGSYLTGHLTVIEELPKNIKDIGDFINVLKSNSQARTLDVEEKKEKPRKIENRTDFIINTNYNVSQMFYNKADALALSKRFRIITRKTIDVAKYSETLDKYGVKDVDHFHGYCFYRYLYKNEKLLKYFEEHRKDKSEIEKLYISASTNDTTDKLDTDRTEDEFLEWFKDRFIDKNKCLRIGLFTDYLKRNNIFKDIKQQTLRQQLLMSKCLHVEGKYNKITIEEIKNIYTKYFNYIENEDEEENEN